MCNNSLSVMVKLTVETCYAAGVLAEYIGKDYAAAACAPCRGLSSSKNAGSQRDKQTKQSKRNYV